MPPVARHRLVRASVLVGVVSLASAACTVATGSDAVSGPERAALTASLATMPADLTAAAPAEDVVATFTGTTTDGDAVSGLVAWTDAGCTVAVSGRLLGDESDAASVLSSAATVSRADGAVYPGDDLFSGLVDGSDVVSTTGPPGTGYVEARCGVRGIHVTLWPALVDVSVAGAAAAPTYSNGVPLGIVVGSRTVRSEAAGLAAEADAPEPRVLALPRLTVDATPNGFVDPPGLQHVIATFTFGDTSAAVVHDGTGCAVSVLTGPDTGMALGAEADLSGTSAPATVLTPSASGGATGQQIALACARSTVSVRLSATPAADVVVDGAADVAPGPDGAGALVVAGPADARAEALRTPLLP